MKFVDTYRFSPVAMGLDKPHADDLFHFDVSEIPVKKEERAKFIEENHIIIDKQWWAKQYQRCIHGYTVENAITEGGDAIEDNKDAFWKGNNCFIPQYDLFLMDRKVHISGFYYFFLNFWKIYGVDADKKEGSKDRKTIGRPRFLDHQFLLTRRLEMAEEQSKDLQEFKGRQLGFSELIAALVAYYFLFYKSSLNIIVGGTQTDSDHTFENCDRGLELLLNTQFYLVRARGGDNKSLIKSKHTKSEIRSLTAKDNEQSLSRFCFGKDTKVRMFNGSIKNIQDIKIGDKIMGVDSTVRNVLETHSGTDQMYKIYSEKTDSFTCNSNHLLYCYHKPVARKNNISKGGRWVCNNFNNKKTIKVDDTHFLIRAEDYYNTSPTFKRNTFIEKNKSIEYKKNKLLIDPYFIGLWLGDGEKGSLRFTVNSEEKEILEYLEYFAFSHCCSVKIEKARYVDFLGRDSKANRVSISYRDRLGKSHKPMRNYLLDEMRGIGIFHDKFIPKKYLYSSRNDRLLLLAGLIDTDGWRIKTKYGFEHYAIAQVDRKLVYQIKELVASLGFYVNVSKPKDNGSINGYKGQPIYEIYISGVGIHNIPVRLKKKKIKEYKYKLNPLRARMDIDKVGIDEFYGITIDGDELFLLEDYTIVHNSPTLIIYEEIGKGKRDWSINVSNFVTPSIFTNTSKTGLQVYIGTSGDMEEGAADLEKRHYNPEKYRILSFKNVYEPEGENVGDKRVGHFTAKWWYKVIDKDGNTKKKESIELLLEERKNIEPSNLYIHITQNPIYASEAFQISTLGYFGANKISALNKRRIEIKQNKAFQLEKRGNLIVKDKTKSITYDNLEFEYCPNGWLNIIEEPIREKNGKAYVNLYIAGVDTYNTDESFYSDSKGAMYVKKRFLPEDPLMNTYVAELVERPDANEGGLELFYEHTMLVATWYNSKVNIEYVDKRIFDYYTSNGFEHLLYQRPRLAFANKIARSVLNNPYGTDKTLKPHGLSLLSDRLSDEYIGNMFFMRQIDALSKFKYSKKYNCDITIATMECEIASSEDEMLEVRIQDEMGTRIKRRKWKRINGRIIEIYV